MTQARMYTGMARPPLMTAAATHNRRTRAGSRSKYSARPPATPAHMRSRLLRMSRLGWGGPGGVGVYGDAWGWGGGGNSGPMHVPPVVPTARRRVAVPDGRAVSSRADETTRGRSLLHRDDLSLAATNSGTH